MAVFAKVIIGDSRKMLEVENHSVDLVVTSPPYWHIKDYGVEGQIGYGQSLHEYLKSLYKVWKECFRVLKPGSRLCINIGDQFLRSVVYGSYKIVPLHSEMIVQCEKIGFDYMGAVIWQKKTTMNTTGGANIMGSYPYPPNGMIEIDYEFILIFKKPGKKSAPKEIKEASKLTKEEWKEFFYGHWNFAGERQIMHEAMFPEELPRRLIKMFTYVNDVVLDPFLGSGTTLRAAINLERNGIGYEINEAFLPIIKQKLAESLSFLNAKVEIIKRSEKVEIEEFIDYEPNIKDAKPLTEPKKMELEDKELRRVKRILSENSVELDDGRIIKLLGIRVLPEKTLEAKNYLENFVKGKEVFLKFDPSYEAKGDELQAYLFLKNKIFVNKEMIRQGFAVIQEGDFMYKNKFLKLQEVKNE